MYRAIIFDIDGTLLDSVDQHAEAWRQAFDQFGYSFPFPEIRYQIGKGGDKLLEAFLTPEQIHQQGKQIEKFRAELFKKKFLQNCEPFPGVTELFEKIRQDGRKIALASSASRDEAANYEKLLNIKGLSNVVVTKDDVENSKPDPDVLAVARKKLGDFSASECVFVGDTPHDASAAEKDQMKMIGVLCGGFPEKDLRDAGAAEIYADPQALLSKWKF